MNEQEVAGRIIGTIWSIILILPAAVLLIYSFVRGLRVVIRPALAHETGLHLLGRCLRFIVYMFLIWMCSLLLALCLCAPMALFVVYVAAYPIVLMVSAFVGEPVTPEKYFVVAFQNVWRSVNRFYEKADRWILSGST